MVNSKCTCVYIYYKEHMLSRMGMFQAADAVWMPLLALLNRGNNVEEAR